MTDERLSHAAFGERFFAEAVTAERILGAVRGLTGEPIAFGPKGVGPGRVVQVTATGSITEPEVEPVRGDEIRFLLTIPVDLALELDFGVDVHRFRCDVTVPVELAARAAPPLRVVIDVEPPTAEDVGVHVVADGMRAGLLRRAAGLDREIARFVARYVAKELDEPGIRAARDIDVAGKIDRAWRR